MRARPIATARRLKRVPKMGVHALWFDQPAILPDAWTRPTEGEDAVGSAGQAIAPQGLSCAGYGSVVTVTAAMGMAAANEALRLALSAPVSASAYKATNTIPSSIRTG